MRHTKKNVAVILAGGSGKRMGGEVPKQFLIVAGQSILSHTINVFQSHRYIDEIIIVGHADYIEEIRTIVNHSAFSKVIRIIKGGTERYHSTLAALKVCCGTDCNLIIHDAVRPLVNDRIIDDVIDSLNYHKAVGVAIPATDTIVETEAGQMYITHIPDRAKLFQMQTPQGFDYATLKKAFDIALNDPDFTVTDDCGVIKKYFPEEKIFLVHGDVANIKLTWPEDLVIVEKKLMTKNKPGLE